MGSEGVAGGAALTSGRLDLRDHVLEPRGDLGAQLVIRRFERGAGAVEGEDAMVGVGERHGDAVDIGDPLAERQAVAMVGVVAEGPIERALGPRPVAA